MSDKSCLGFALAIIVGLFSCLWVAGLWMNPDTRDWAHSLPYNLGFPVFVLIGVALSVGALVAPLIIWSLFNGSGPTP